MKKLQLFAYFVALFTVASCEVEPIDPAVLATVTDGTDAGSGSGSTANFFRANFDGATWEAVTTQAIVNSEYYAITGIKPDGTVFQITIPNASTGTFTHSNITTTNFGLAYIGGNGQVPYIGVSNATATTTGYTGYNDTAEITITSVNTTTNIIKGTFKFTGVRFNSTLTATQTKTFTQGEFSIPFVNDVAPPVGNSFFVKMDGVDYNPTNITGVVLGSNINLVGRRGSVESVGLTFPKTITPGTYAMPLSQDIYSAIYVPDNTGTNNFGHNSGSLVIISHNTTTKRITGTFNFQGKNFVSGATKEFTQGTFDITYL